MPGETQERHFDPKGKGRKAYGEIMISQKAMDSARAIFRQKEKGWFSASYCSVSENFPVKETQGLGSMSQLRSSRKRYSIIRSMSNILRNAGVGLSIFACACGQAFAQTSFSLVPGASPESSSVVLTLAVFGGIVSFAILSAFWLIRERARIGDENQLLKRRFTTLKAERDHLSALLDVSDQRMLVWDGATDKVRTQGRFEGDENIPLADSDFVAFGKWLSPKSASELERSIEALRKSGKQFSLPLTTIKNIAMEAQGRVSGDNAFVRFTMIQGAREELGKIKSEHAGLLARFELLQSLFDRLSSPFWIQTRDGKLAYANIAYATAVDESDPNEAVEANKPLFDAKEREILVKAQSEQGHYSGVLPAIVAGDRRNLETFSVANNAGFAGIAIDRSDAEFVRKMLKQTIASHQQTFDHLASAVAIFDAKQKLQFFNTSFQQLWDFKPADLEGDPSNNDILEMLRSNKKLQEMPDWRKWKETQLDSYKLTEARADYWHLPDGRTLRVIVNPQNQGGTSWVFENVTEELELKSSYNALMRVQGETLDHLNEAVAVFGSDGKIRLTNPAFAQMWHMDAEKRLVGMHMRTISSTIASFLVTPKAFDPIDLGITGVDDTRQDISGRLELKSGSFIDYRLAYLPEGQSMLTLADMTAAVNVERALQERNEALEESGALKSRFIQHVSYELRVPLTSISGFTEILASGATGNLNVKQNEYLEYISSSSDVLRRLIDDILDLATIDAGVMQLEFRQFSIAAIVQESLDAIADKIERFGLKTVVKIDKTASNMVGDPVRMRQVFYNLISNAANASPDGGQIEISADQRDGMIEFGVSDQGPGVPEEKRLTIFERFEAGNGGERQRGAGLGLSIVKSFVALHGGTIEVTNAKGRGAKFTCRIPLEPALDQQAAE